MADAPYSMTIRELVRESFQTSYAHGWWDDPETAETLPSKLMLMVSELAEALESYRDPESDSMVKVPAGLIDALLYGSGAAEDPEYNAMDQMKARDALEATYAQWQAKPKGFDIELADALIRIFDLAGQRDIDLDHALRVKMDYNKGRPHRHGGRKV